MKIEGELKYVSISIGFIVIACSIAIVYSVINPAPSQIEAFVGRLYAIEYEQNGWQSSVSATVLHFQNNISFRQNGYYQYALSCEYKVTYKIFTNSGIITVLNVEPNA